MAPGGAFDARLDRTRKDVEKLHHGMRNLAKQMQAEPVAHSA